MTGPGEDGTWRGWVPEKIETGGNGEARNFSSRSYLCCSMEICESYRKSQLMIHLSSMMKLSLAS